MFNESAQLILGESTKIILGIGQIIVFIGVIWKIAIDTAKIKHDISNLKKAQEEADKLRREKWQLHKEEHKEEKDKHFEEHKEIKKVMDVYQQAIHEQNTKIDILIQTNKLQFQSIEAKIDQTQAMLQREQNRNEEERKMQNEITSELIKAIKEMDNNRRKE